MTIHTQSVRDIARGIQENHFTLEDLFQSFLKVVAQEDELSIWQDYNQQLAVVSRGKGILSGVLVGIKDNIATSEFPTTMGVRSWRGTTGGFDARVVSRLRDSGCVIAGKTKCSAFAVHDTTGTINPRYPDSEPGTSSSGSAAAVAASHVSLALGTQTAGSISKPASYCGVIGFKPTFGEIPRTGVLKTTEMFDSVGFFGRRISDIEILYLQSRVSGRNHPVHEKRRAVNHSLRFKKALMLSGRGVDHPTPALSAKFYQTVQSISDESHLQLDIVSPFSFEELRASLFKIYYRELAYFLQDQKFTNEVSNSLSDIISLGRSVSAHEYESAKVLVSAWRKFVSQIPTDTLIFSLATSQSAPLIGHEDLIDANFFITSAGLPQLSVPMLRDEGGRLVNLSISAARNTDETLLSFGYKIFPYDALVLPSYA